MIDRNSPESARSALEGFLPDPEGREQVLDGLAQSIEAAAEHGASRWSVTLHPEGHVNTNVGRLFAFSIHPGEAHIIVQPIEGQEFPAETEEFGVKTVPEMRWCNIPAKSFADEWPRWLPFHLAAVERAAKTARRTPYFKAHSPGVIDFLSSFLERDLPRPDHSESEPQQDVVDRLVGLVERCYPSWSGFADERFVADEEQYKREAVALFEQQLGRAELRRLIETAQLEEVVNRVKKVGQATNLLWLAVPKQGDLSLLHQDNFDSPNFCAEFEMLLYGEGSSADRLVAFAEWAEANGLPAKWAFPTYFLFLSDPTQEFFVKPQATEFMLNELGFNKHIGGKPSGERYEEVLAAAHALQDKLSDSGPKDLLDIQGFIWVAHMEAQKILIGDERRSEFDGLIGEFARTYPESSDGKAHLDLLTSCRLQAQKNFAAVKEIAAQGGDITDSVIRGFLPHTDTPKNRETGAWVAVAPAVVDARAFFEGAGLKEPEDWPQVAELILGFVERCVVEPSALKAAVEDFTSNPHSKGLQTGMISPILNALEPDHFLIVNNKSRRLINILAETKYRQALADYPAANETGFRLAGELASVFEANGLTSLSPGDNLDMFSHWLTAVKHYNFKQRFWKIAPGERARFWDQCLEGGYILIGWDELGDVSGINKTEFEERLAQTAEKMDWAKVGARQVWTFSRISEGDIIVANKGKSEVVGIGTVIGPYFYAREGDYRHRLPVEWFDTRPRNVGNQGWQRTVLELHYPGFKQIVDSESLPPPPVEDSLLSRRAFELLEGIRENPTKEYWTDHKSEFQSEIEGPFKTFFSGIAEEFPDELKRRLEVQKGVFGRFLKNDYGRGGAWTWYWGAFYPKDSKRTVATQLFCSVNYDYLEYGFGFGDYKGEHRQQFERNAQQHHQFIIDRFGDSLDAGGFEFGKRAASDEGEDLLAGDFREWIAGPSQFGSQVRVVVSRDQLLATSKKDLHTAIANAFERFTPLVILADEDDPLPFLDEVELPINDPYPLDQFAQDTGFTEDQLRTWVKAIERKGQAVLYGPPGTGKTYVAERLARHLIGGTIGTSDLVQFHPAYSYEDFMQGIRPKEGADGSLTYPTVKGRFMQFCRNAQLTEDPYVLIIDEINRANLARVFGELMYLLEYRDNTIPLAGGGKFKIPSNVRIIGTMNTADRSIALVDHALRRRFAFLTLLPDFDVLRRYHEREETDFDPSGLIHTLERLNKQINDPNYSVGITFFLRTDIEDQVEDIWNMEILPYLSEYFFDSPSKVAEFEWPKVEQPILRWNPQSDT